MLQGTSETQKFGAVEKRWAAWEQRQLGKFRVFSFGHGSKGNRSTGVQVAFNTNKFDLFNVVAVEVPEQQRLPGRAGSVRVASGRLDMFFFQYTCQ